MAQLIVLLGWVFAHQAIPAAVTVSGDVPHAVTLTASDLKTLPQHSVTSAAHDQSGTYTGPALRDVLTKAGYSTAPLRGPALASYVVVGGADGYRAVFALAELDQEFTDREIILALTMNGKALPDNALPFQIIVPGEKRPARWVRQVVGISIQTAK